MSDSQEATSLQVEGLNYYVHVSGAGEIISESGETNLDLADGSPLILTEAARLGNIVGLDEIREITAIIDGRQVVIQTRGNDACAIIASKNSSPTKLFAALNQEG